MKRPPKIVIVEDHVMFREILRKVCEKELKLKVVGESGDGGQAAELVKRLQPIPVEAVVRGYLAGSGWKEYQESRSVCGVPLPEGLTNAAKLPEPIYTPAAKAAMGEHDENITFERTVEMIGLQLATRIRDLSIAIYKAAAEIALAKGMIIADTKFEFGLAPDGTLVLMDEVLTPDSSRYWYTDSYESHFSKGIPQRALDKEYLRSWLLERKWSGNGEPPAIPDEVFAELSWRYVQAFQDLGGADFESISAGFESEAREILSILR